MDPQFFDGRRVRLVESCPCSEERVLRTLRLLPRDEIDDILAKNEEVGRASSAAPFTVR